MNCAQTPRRLWDISPPIQEGSPVFLGDSAYALTWHARIGTDCPVNVSQIRLSPHTGAHADAPLHYDPNGATVGSLDLRAFLGPCRVIHCMSARPQVSWQDIEHVIDAPQRPARILLRTYLTMPAKQFDPDLPAIAPDVIDRLANLGVLLIGTDSASIDSATSKTLSSHQMIRRHGLRVLENLCLDEVDEGDYELIALPLKLMQAEASPVRAVLREL